MPLAVGSSLLVYYLNTIFYFNMELGTDGLALATLITIVILNIVKLWFVHYKFSITPFTPKSLKLLFIILFVFLAFYFWNFSIPNIEIASYSISPIINIALKSILITIIYVFLIFKLNISNEFDVLLQKFYKWQSK
jgi:hypothetical protein